MPRRRAEVSEQAVAEVVVMYLEELGADVYQEVEVRGGVADIVARVNAEIWIIEVKTSLSLALLSQAMDRRRLAHRVYIAAPESRHTGEVAEICSELGIGLFAVDVPHPTETWRRPRVLERAGSRRWNKRPVALAAALQPEHKTHAKAGASSAKGRWTPFRSTCEQLARIVRDKPGVTLKEAITQLQHHYASDAGARRSIAHWIEHDKIPGVRFERKDGALTLQPVPMA